MTFDQDALGWMLGAFPRERFLAEYLNRRWVRCEGGSPDRFADLLSFEQLDAILGTYGLRFPDIRLVRSEADVPATEYVWKDHLVDPMRVGRLFAEGTTVIFGALQDRHEEIRRLCARLAGQAGARTQANIYLTPPESQGFKPHWDTHDVFVMQVEGAKRWRIYGGGPHRPLPTQKFDPEKHAPGEVEAEFTLSAGEVLYIPRGVMHAAVATDAVSLHITLGLIAYTWSDVLLEGFSAAVARDPAWRESLPFGFGADGGPAALQRELAARIGTLPAAIDVPGVIAERLQQVEAAHRPRVTDHLRQAMAARDLSAEDVVGKRSGLPSRLETRGDRVVLRAGERELDFPSAAHRTLETVLQERTIRLSDVDDGLDWSGRKTVVAKLIREGILSRAGANVPLQTSEVSRDR